MTVIFLHLPQAMGVGRCSAVAWAPVPNKCCYTTGNDGDLEGKTAVLKSQKLRGRAEGRALAGCEEMALGRAQSPVVIAYEELHDIRDSSYGQEHGCR